MDQELLELERAAWHALSTSGEAATAFFREALDDRVLFLLPLGLVVDDRDEVLDSMGGEPWRSWRLEGEQVVPLGPDAAVVAYTAHAQRGDDPEYHALVNSTYRRTPAGWRLALHQQTPF